MDIHFKANRILAIVAFVMLFLIARVFYLSVLQHDRWVEIAEAPQVRQIIKKPNRGTICDRFNEPLAVNRIQYNLSVVYSEIRALPYFKRVKDSKTGKFVKKRFRIEYVEDLSNFLAKTLNMDAQRIEDIIYSKAAIFPNVPFIIKENISERGYCRLKILERDWPGMHVEMKAKRIYPRGAVAANIIGYMGAISRKEYDAITKERVYTINDHVGKTGIEKRCDEDLRGFCGKKLYESDAKNNFLSELPDSKEPIPGKRILLTISSELQEYAEQLLAANEGIRDNRSHKFNQDDRSFAFLKQPWIKGGAVVAIEPNSGEVLAMASYPRYNPNDFTNKNNSEIRRWLESEDHIAEIWDRKVNLERERFSTQSKSFYKEGLELTWEAYLDFILPQKHPALPRLKKMTIKDAIEVQRKGSDEPIVVDLCRLAVDESLFSERLLDAVGNRTISFYRDFVSSAIKAKSFARRAVLKFFRENDFKSWRERELKAFLRKKREEEREKKTFQRPYLDYLDREERRQFKEFWAENGDSFVADYLEEDELNGDLVVEYLNTALAFKDLTKPLLKKHPGVKGKQLKHLAAAFYLSGGFGYSRSFAFRYATAPGSIFKMVTGYSWLMDQFKKTGGISSNAFKMVDKKHQDENGNWFVGYTSSGKPIPRFYKGGLLLRSSRKNIGSVDLLKAIETSSNPYFSLIAAELGDPNDLKKTAELFDFGTRSGIHLPGETGGNLPDDLCKNKTGLYATADGQHSLMASPLQVAMMLSAIANGGKVLAPKILFNGEPLLKREIEMPREVQRTLLEGMRRVVVGESGTARASSIRGYRDDPEAMVIYSGMQDQIVAKTGTSEVVERVDLGPANIYNHIWCGGIIYGEGEKPSRNKFGTPELVVVVFLRFGDYGKEAAPLIAQVAKKWREIKQRHKE